MKHKQGKQRHRNLQALLSSLIVLCLALILIFVNYIGTLKTIIETDTTRNLQEVSEHLGELVNTRVRDDVIMFETLMESYQRASGWRNNLSIDEFFNSRSDDHNFQHVAITDETGAVTLADGTTISYASSMAFQRAINGELAVSWSEEAPYSQVPSIIFAMPYTVNGQNATAIAEKNTQDMIESLSLSSFNGQGVSCIVDLNGNFTMKSSNWVFNQPEDNLFKVTGEDGAETNIDLMNQLKTDFVDKKAGFFTYTFDDETYYTTYQPLKAMEWTLVMIVPQKVVDAKINLITSLSFLVGGATMICFVVLVLLFFYRQKKHINEINHILYVDPITGGKSHARFQKDVKELLSTSSEQYCLVLMNVEKFKLINDLFSMEEGNRTLHYIFSKINEELTQGEAAARYEADSFVLLLRFHDKKTVDERLNRIANQINSYQGVEEMQYYLMMNAGIYIITDHTQDYLFMLDRAITARKNVQEHSQGYIDIAYYSDQILERLHKEKQIINSMHQALARHEFVVYLQPKVNLQTNEIAGAEALVRWFSEDLGFVSPGDFIPVFESNGFIIQLDLYVFEETCKILRRWLDEGTSTVPISVNMSLVHLKNVNFLKEYIRIKNRYQIPAGLLEIELTETIRPEDIKVLQKTITELHEAGLGYELDDFGSGYSSLNMLREIAVDTLKLDRAFFGEMFGSGDLRGELVVKNMLNLAKSLDIETVAEGVESLRQVEWLRKAGCDLVQGYVFSKPLPVHEFEELRKKQGTEELCLELDNQPTSTD